MLRRFGIFRLKTKYANMCFKQRLNSVVKPAVANLGTTAAAADLQIQALRQNPDLGEWRVCLGVPTGGGWTIWGTKSAYDGIEVHVTISNTSIQLPGAAVDTFANGTTLCNALFTLP